MNDIEDILDEFDFHKVQTAMKALNWKYFYSEGDCPTIAELRRVARSLLQNADKAPTCPTWPTSSGGFEVTRIMEPGDTKKYFSLKFVVTEWNNHDS